MLGDDDCIERRKYACKVCNVTCKSTAKPLLPLILRQQLTIFFVVNYHFYPSPGRRMKEPVRRRSGTINKCDKREIERESKKERRSSCLTREREGQTARRPCSYVKTYRRHTSMYLKSRHSLSTLFPIITLCLKERWYSYYLSEIIIILAFIVYQRYGKEEKHNNVNICWLL